MDGQINLATLRRPFLSGRQTLGPRKARSAKQLLGSERERVKALLPTLPTHFSVQAGPSIRRPYKYCDVTGLPAIYTDPKTGMRYRSPEVYKHVKALGIQGAQGLLSLRNAHTILK
ncbi:hypothetical protein BJ684DRAFT_8418 [Piptocephalis cylindrospora]|uniref:Vps72/YL1 C-terminal domain-containing protein n=1 Tax=Piptocephalis cylindrospora TaxID=1907219 RepID=A0A4P9Y656_9FUNG|nr:hypothetical protein BJ684DRAFT_8418 [Piptocephalis cylindrospora]|eukprot:RKP14548.1 hypothetical protein BJ684DRAFT_8418 [Piptocephalis cylindrospora]